MKRNQGQVMLLTVVLLSGAILGATSIAGLLMLYQVRNLTDVSQSAKSVFAADAGIEWALYLNFKGNCFDSDPGNDELFCAEPPPSFSNGAEFTYTTVEEEDEDTGEMVTTGATAVGFFNRSARAFEIEFEGATIPLFSE